MRLGWAYTLSKGQVIRISGTSIVDFVAFNQDDLTERFDQARTKVYNRKIFISTGDVLMSKSNWPMLTIIEDTYREKRVPTTCKMVCAVVPAGNGRPKRGGSPNTFQGHPSRGIARSWVLGEPYRGIEALEHPTYATPVNLTCFRPSLLIPKRALW